MIIYRVYHEGTGDGDEERHIGIYDNEQLAKLAAEATGNTYEACRMNDPPDGFIYRPVAYQCTLYKPFGEMRIVEFKPQFWWEPEGKITGSRKAIKALSFVSAERAKTFAIAQFEKWQKQVSRKTWEGK